LTRPGPCNGGEAWAFIGQSCSPITHAQRVDEENMANGPVGDITGENKLQLK